MTGSVRRDCDTEHWSPYRDLQSVLSEVTGSVWRDCDVIVHQQVPVFDVWESEVTGSVRRAAGLRHGSEQGLVVNELLNVRIDRISRAGLRLEKLSLLQGRKGLV